MIFPKRTTKTAPQILRMVRDLQTKVWLQYGKPEAVDAAVKLGEILEDVRDCGVMEEAVSS